MKVKKGLWMGAMGAGVTCWGVCEWLFRFAIARKPWTLPDFPGKKLSGSGEPDEYERQADLAESEVRKLPYEEAVISSSDGLKLRGRFYPGKERNRDVFLAVHGCRNRGTREYCFLTSYYRRIGVSYLLIDQRACGESEGEYMTYGVKESEDVLRWLSWLKERCGEDSRIYLHGISMGAATVLMAAGKELPKQVTGVIADCSYTCAQDEFSYQLGTSFHLPAGILLPVLNGVCKRKAGFDFEQASPIEAVKHGKVPCLFIHGGADDFVPYRMMDELFRACTAPKEKVTVDGAVHARSYYKDPKMYEESVERFRQKYGSADTGVD